MWLKKFLSLSLWPSLSATLLYLSLCDMKLFEFHWRASLARRLASSVCCSVLQCIAVCCSVLKSAHAIGKRTDWRVAVCCSMLQFVAVCCSALQCVAMCWSVCIKSSYQLIRGLIDSWGLTPHLQHTATHCNTLQHTAPHCNTLQHTATHCNTLPHTYR